MNIVLCVLLLTLLIIVIILFFKIKKSEQFNKEILDKLDNTNSNDKIYDLELSVNEKLNTNSYRIMNEFNNTKESMNKIVLQLNEFNNTNSKVVDIAKDMKGLQDIMLNPKQRGSFGETQLYNTLENTFDNKQWEKQYKFNDDSIVDAILKLNDNKILPIDSKFPMESYLRMTSSKTEQEKQQAEKDLKNSLKKRIDETSKYVKPNEKTLDIALMYIPSESLYYYLLNNSVGENSNNRDLLEYAFRDKHVIIVGPTSLMAFVEVIINGLKSLAIEKEAKDIQKNVIKLQSHLGKFNDSFKKMGKNLNTIVNTFNTTQKQLELIDKDQFLITDIDRSIKCDKVDKIEE